MDVDGCSNIEVEIIGSFCFDFSMFDFVLIFPVENLPQSCFALV